MLHVRSGGLGPDGVGGSGEGCPLQRGPRSPVEWALGVESVPASSCWSAVLGMFHARDSPPKKWMVSACLQLVELEPSCSWFVFSVSLSFVARGGGF